MTIKATNQWIYMYQNILVSILLKADISPLSENSYGSFRNFTSLQLAAVAIVTQKFTGDRLSVGNSFLIFED